MHNWRLVGAQSKHWMTGRKFVQLFTATFEARPEVTVSLATSKPHAQRHTVSLQSSPAAVERWESSDLKDLLLLTDAVRKY